MFQSFEMYFRKYKSTLARVQGSDPVFISQALTNIFQEKKISISMESRVITLQKGCVVIRGLSGGERHILTKQKTHIDQEIRRRTGGVIVEVRLG